MSLVRGLIPPLVLVLGIVAWARRWLDAVEVRGGSMAPTLLPGDRLLVARLARAPRVGEVVVAADPRDPRRELIKRVASLHDRHVALRGDAPFGSTDSRSFGEVSVAAVRWIVLGRYWPLSRVGGIGPAPVGALEPIDEGGEAACTFPEALIAGD